MQQYDISSSQFKQNYGIGLFALFSQTCNLKNIYYHTKGKNQGKNHTLHYTKLMYRLCFIQHKK